MVSTCTAVTSSRAVTSSSSLDPVFEGLAVVALSRWSEITLPNAVRWLAKATQIPDRGARLTNR
jgi:hypothetical protein